MADRTFLEVVTNYVEKLDLYTNAITKAHGQHHPETFEVKELYEMIREKVKNAGENKPNLDSEFARLRKVTGNYTIPQDVCETYVATYKMLSEVDEAYQA
ncbi:iron-sulfur cluster repair di-iron protein, ric [Pallidibacillus pasinlerensis]|uniref:Iron-sulfur cluster repair di-iron protein, ric n=1 Tax=Pallidibacillus pasinlerensis TaxID=2703818 RepID=A0ABX0A7S6_9BACI|nr:iron-sulfur cluster repair di-iron protein, ric [Pallidibacillus pasinlerensis]NCU17500.1 iron-sulfur cluster repair di-iron protein, ric [Pallidibacillus pasinlerensis]